jgi:hypothetical protein
MEGTCLCGSITVQTPDKTEVDACHCGMCRRWGGGPALGLSCGSAVEIVGRDKLKVYSSSPWAERAFCGDCGSHIFYRLVEPDHYFVPAGLFQDGPAFTFTEQIYVDNKPDYYEFANPTLMLTEADVMAKFGLSEAPQP